MNASPSYRRIEPGEEAAVVALVLGVFDADVARQYSPEGIAEFRRYVEPCALAERGRAGHFTLLALVDGRIVGMTEVRHYEHISLLFVEPAFQRRGIARGLVERALAVCRRERPDLREVTVNSSPNAVEAYARLGFSPLGEERAVNGIRFTPMALSPTGSSDT